MPHKTRAARLAYFRRYNARNRKARNAQAETCRQKRPDRRLAYWRAYNNAHRAQRFEKIRDWKMRNQKRVRASNRAAKLKRRAIQLAVTVNPEAISAFVDKVRSKRFALCYYCGRKILSRTAHFDHVIPLQGREPGPHEVGNLAVSCGKCNRSKSNISLALWQKDGQQILPL